jgi:hypothetical protein
MIQNHTVISGTLLNIVRGDFTAALVISVIAPQLMGALLRSH